MLLNRFIRHLSGVSLTARGAAVLVMLVVLVAIFQMASPSDIDDNDQPITIAHFMDVALEGHWLSQFNPFEGLSTKPPMYHWLGGLMVMTTQQPPPWLLKLPSLLSFVLTTWLIVLLARTSLSWPLALLAGIFWVANYHVFKLAWTARPDMFLTLWITLAILALQYQRRLWGSADTASPHPPRPSRPMAYWGWLIILWLSVAAAGLTKGPPAFFVVALVLTLLIIDGRLLSRDAWPHALGLAGAALISLGWLGLAIHYYPQWHEVLHHEVWLRMVGNTAKKVGYPTRWNEIFYFVSRFFPWCLLTITAMVVLPWWRRERRNSAILQPGADDRSDSSPQQFSTRWAAWWVVLVLVILAIPKGRRVDHILPVYAGAAVLAAALVDQARRGHRLGRIVTHLVLGGVCIFGLVCTAGAYWLPRPGVIHWPVALVAPVVAADHVTLFLVVGAGLTLVAGLGGLWSIHHRHYYRGSLLTAVVMMGVLILYQGTLNRSARNRNGDYIIAVARTAQRVLEQEHRQPVFYDTGYVPIQSLMGYQRPMDTWRPATNLGPEQLLLVTSVQGWEKLQEQGGQGQVILQTPRLVESKRRVVLVRPTRLPSSAAPPGEVSSR